MISESSQSFLQGVFPLFNLTVAAEGSFMISANISSNCTNGMIQ